jgi:CO/xanthine dehydrogenase FAD-binding subunit
MTDVQTVPTLAEAARQMGADSAYMGGGTVLMRDVNAGEAPPRLVRATDPALTELRAMGDRVTIGAGVTMAQILAQRELEFLHPVARQIGGPQVRNMGTVGGNLFAPHPYGDFAVALLALGAQVTMAGGSTPGPLMMCCAIATALWAWSPRWRCRAQLRAASVFSKSVG